MTRITTEPDFYRDVAALQQDVETLKRMVRTLSSVPAVTSLPATPFDGQEINYLADSANGVVWKLKYRLAIASAYKWEFVGGGKLTFDMGGAQSNAFTWNAGNIGTWQDYSGAPAPQVTLPTGFTGGDFMVEHSCSLYSNAAQSTGCYVGVTYIGNYTDAIVLKQFSTSDQAVWQSIASAPRTFVTVAAGCVLRQQYQFGLAATMYVQRARVAVIPVRIG